MSGRVEVLKKGVGAPIARLGAGDFFGEIALLTDAPRTASVRCVEATVLLALDRDSFRELMSIDFCAGMRLEQAAERRQ